MRPREYLSFLRKPSLVKSQFFQANSPGNTGQNKSRLSTIKTYRSATPHTHALPPHDLHRCTNSLSFHFYATSLQHRSLSRLLLFSYRIAKRLSYAFSLSIAHLIPRPCRWRSRCDFLGIWSEAG